MAKHSYILSHKIARGGMAEIYLGKAVGSDSFQRIVAIKRILPHYAQDQDFIAMFRDEANICKRLQHANIVQVHDFCEVEESYALIMEYVAGADLRSVLQACEVQKKRLSIPMALFLTASAARGLHYAHTKVDEVTQDRLGIVHRDISPQNILISYEGEVKITDFGIASADDKVNETRPGVVKGKYSYMSPEQVTSKHLDGRSDVFSLAIVLWETLAMRCLFGGQTEVETIRRVQHCDIKHDLKALNNQVDDTLLAIIYKALAKDPKERYPTAANFEKALTKYLHSHYPDFLTSDLGGFVKVVLGDRFQESMQIVKKTLTSNAKAQSPGLNQTKKAIPDEGLKSLEYNADDIFRIAPDIKAPEKAVHKSPLRIVKPSRHAKGAHVIPRHKRRPWAAIVLVLAVLLGVGWGGFEFGPGVWKRYITQQVELDLRVRPSRVQVYLNGQNLQKLQRKKTRFYSLYSNTPVSIKSLASGQGFEVLIKRPGYLSQSFKVAEANEVDGVLSKSIRLKPRPGVLWGSLEMRASQPVEVSLNKGLAIGRLPLRVKGLVKGLRHELEVYLPHNGRKFRCGFRLPRAKPHAVLMVEVVKNAGVKCQVR